MLTDVLNDVTYQCGATRLRISRKSQHHNLQRLSYDPFEELRFERMFQQGKTELYCLHYGLYIFAAVMILSALLFVAFVTGDLSYLWS